MNKEEENQILHLERILRNLSEHWDKVYDLIETLQEPDPEMEIKFKKKEPQWKSYPGYEPEHEADYLVSWCDYEGNYSLPQKAFFCGSEKKFFSSENNSFPLAVNIFMKIPKVPEKD
jgi:hypothetical protein